VVDRLHKHNLTEKQEIALVNCLLLIADGHSRVTAMQEFAFICGVHGSLVLPLVREEFDATFGAGSWDDLR
jgi:hypothetical protein